MTDFQPPRVDGIADEWLPRATIHEIMELDRRGFSVAIIAASLKIDVLSVESALRTVELLKAFSSRMER